MLAGGTLILFSCAVVACCSCCCQRTAAQRAAAAAAAAIESQARTTTTTTRVKILSPFAENCLPSVLCFASSERVSGRLAACAFVRPSVCLPLWPLSATARRCSSERSKRMANNVVAVDDDVVVVLLRKELLLLPPAAHSHTLLARLCAICVCECLACTQLRTVCDEKGVCVLVLVCEIYEPTSKDEKY